jgi:hypothetical protein
MRSDASGARQPYHGAGGDAHMPRVARADPGPRSVIEMTQSSLVSDG